VKFRCINIHNVNALVPTWAVSPLALARQLEAMFSTPEGAALLPTRRRLFGVLDFWIEVDATAAPVTVRVATPDGGVDLRGKVIITCASIAHERAQIQLPLNPFLKGYPSLDDRYCIYYHAFQAPVPLGYVGLTRQRWFQRLAQHVSSARNASPYLFHRAFRDHPGVLLLHKVVYCDIDHDSALELEEDLVGMYSLYPLGLNMIPGGRAGFAYLGRLGLQARTAEERDATVEHLAARESVEGRTNPLCAARWASDPDFVERVVCGHSGRLTAEQVRQVRLWSTFGYAADFITQSLVGTGNARQVSGVLAGKHYSRIK